MSDVFVCCKWGNKALSKAKTKLADIEKGKKFYLIHVRYKILEFPHSFTDSSSSHLHTIQIHMGSRINLKTMLSSRNK